jgi:hypothetical protein
VYVCFIILVATLLSYHTMNFHWIETNLLLPTRKVLSYNMQPARSSANAIKNVTGLHLPARKIISLCPKFRTPPLYSHLIGSTLSCIKTVKFQDINLTMIWLCTKCSPVLIILQVLRWGVQPLAPLSKYLSLYTHLNQVASDLELMVSVTIIITYRSNFTSATVVKKML